ncbi:MULTISPECIES: hypothetical protein [Pseudomonas]|uniref:hypothetical protein n=1 Tax=Pseudomonas TaxID=286 RepID=UPI000BA3C799|nr:MULTISPECIES: hypothetical protein [Pseudomonas]MDR9864403.1 hypothetical protein [Pseudomonas baetica]
MPEVALVPKFLKLFAAEHGLQVHDCLYGAIELGGEFPIEQSSAAVYGIWAHMSEPPRRGLAQVPGFSGWYPVYWGKDISPVSRIKAHVQGHKNGNIGLPGILELSGARLVFGAVLVSEYQRFEALLHQHCPPFKGTPSIGRQGTVVRVR